MENEEQRRMKPPKKILFSGFCSAAIIFLLSFLFVKSLFGPSLGFGMFIFTVGFDVLLFVTKLSVAKKGQRYWVDKQTILWCLLILWIGMAFLYSDNNTVKMIALFLDINITVYGIFVLFDNREGNRIDGFFFLDLLKAKYVMPFGSCTSFFSALLCINAKKGKAFKYVILGLLAAFIPTVVVFLLLSSDVLFHNAFTIMFENLKEELIENLLLVLLSIPVSMYLFGAIFSNINQRFSNILNRDKEELLKKNAYSIPVTVTISALTPMMLLYVIYSMLHIGHYFSAFSGLIPSGFTTSEYARSGFFELCIVAMINLLMLLIGGTFSKRLPNEKKTTIWKVYATLLSCMTLILVSSAVSKMLLYISIYGLTIKRVFAMWIMLFVAIVFIYVIVYQFKSKLPIYKLTFITAIVMYSLYALAGPDAFIAKYNVNAYYNGKLLSIDIESLSELSDQALPYWINLRDEPGEVGEKARNALRSHEANRDFIWNNLSSVNAKNVLKE